MEPLQTSPVARLTARDTMVSEPGPLVLKRFTTNESRPDLTVAWPLANSGAVVLHRPVPGSRRSGCGRSRTCSRCGRPPSTPPFRVSAPGAAGRVRTLALTGAAVASRARDISRAPTVRLAAMALWPWSWCVPPWFLVSRLKLLSTARLALRLSALLPGCDRGVPSGVMSSGHSPPNRSSGLLMTALATCRAPRLLLPVGP